MRKIAAELDPLRIGTGWKVEDLSKPQIFIESTFGDSHPGSGHLDKLVEAARQGVAEAGGYGARYFTTDKSIFHLSESKCTVSARFLHGFKKCKGCKSLQNRTKGAETPSSKLAMYRREITLKRNFQKLRESTGVRYESVGRGFESLPSHQIMKIRTFSH